MLPRNTKKNDVVFFCTFAAFFQKQDLIDLSYSLLK